MKPHADAHCSEKTPLAQTSAISFKTCLRSPGVVRAAGLREFLTTEETLLVLRGKLHFPAVLQVKARTHLKRDSSCLWEVTAMSPCKLSECPDIFPGLLFLSLSPASLYIQLDFHLPLGSSHVFVPVSLLQGKSLSVGACRPSFCYVHTHRGTVSGDAQPWRRLALCSITPCMLPGNTASHGFHSQAPT